MPIVRMAPSPTGNLHIGTARTTLFNYLFAKKTGGYFILRIEDTDTERSTKEYENNILNGLKWLGLEYNELHRQSERTSTYVSYVRKMLHDGSAYISKEEPKEEGKRSEVIRFKNPNKKIVFKDLIRGEVEFDTTDLGDFVIAKSVEEPLYHLAAVVDDHEMKITHVIRGEDHISNTPRQILIQEAIGAERPIYAHIPLIFDKERKKLSKRKHGSAVWIDTYKEEGYLPEAVLNYFALLGWNPGTEQEIFTLKELTEVFSMEGVQKSPAIFDIEKLKWINKEHLKKMDPNDLRIVVEEKVKEKFPNAIIGDDLLRITLERIYTFSDIDKMLSEGEFDFYFSEPELLKDKLIWKESTPKDTKKHLEKISEFLLDAPQNTEAIKSILMPYAEEVGKGNVLWPLRYALSGKEKSPDPFSLIAILGIDKSQARIKRAIELLS
ncbi:MAG: glutamate--tRNA ligase [Parcubacteria group bacterium]